MSSASAGTTNIINVDSIYGHNINSLQLYGRDWAYHGLFRYKLDSKNRSVVFRPDGRAAESALNVVGVDLEMDFGHNTSYKSKGLRPLHPLALGKTQQILQTFKSNFYWPITQTTYWNNFLLFVHISSSVDSFGSHLRDSLYAQQLWESAVDKKWTDVMFQVGNKIFTAHRALLTFRCPSLAALVPEGSPGPVYLDDCDELVFKQLLYFIYTGIIKDQQAIDRNNLPNYNIFGTFGTNQSTNQHHYAHPDINMSPSPTPLQGPDASKLEKFLQAAAVQKFPLETLVELRQATLPPQIGDFLSDVTRFLSD